MFFVLAPTTVWAAQLCLASSVVRMCHGSIDGGSRERSAAIVFVALAYVLQALFRGTRVRGIPSDGTVYTSMSRRTPSHDMAVMRDKLTSDSTSCNDNRLLVS